MTSSQINPAKAGGIPHGNEVKIGNFTQAKLGGF